MKAMKFLRKRWLSDEAEFEQRLRTGRLWELVAAQHLQNLGFDVELSPQGKDGSKLHKNTGDMCINHSSGTHWVEVKSRNIAFTSPEDYPFKDAIVCRADAVYQTKPAFFMLVSRATTEAVVIDANDVWNAQARMVRDERRGYEAATLCVMREKLKPLRWLLERYPLDL